MTKQTTAIPMSAPARAPDPILAELWEVKRQINAEAGYDVDALVRMAHEAAERVGFGRSLAPRREKA